MEESEVKRIRPKNNQEKVERDPNLKGGARGGDPGAKESPPEKEEPPIIQRHSE